MHGNTLHRRIHVFAARSRLFFAAMFVSLPARSQEIITSMVDRPEVLGEGWRGFTDFAFIINALSMLVLATVLGAALGMQPSHGKTTNSLEEIETPQIYTTVSYTHLTLPTNREV